MAKCTQTMPINVTVFLQDDDLIFSTLANQSSQDIKLARHSKRDLDFLSPSRIVHRRRWQTNRLVSSHPQADGRMDYLKPSEPFVGPPPPVVWKPLAHIVMRHNNLRHKGCAILGEWPCYKNFSIVIFNSVGVCSQNTIAPSYDDSSNSLKKYAVDHAKFWFIWQETHHVYVIHIGLLNIQFQTWYICIYM